MSRPYLGNPDSDSVAQCAHCTRLFHGDDVAQCDGCEQYAGSILCEYCRDNHGCAQDRLDSADEPELATA